MSTALLIVDMQNDYFPGGLMALNNIEKAAVNAQRLLNVFRQRQAPVIHVQHCSLRAGATFFLPGTDGMKIHPSVAPAPDEPIVQKNFPNSFQKTSLAETLHDLSAHKLIICGAMTHMCIDSTVRAAFELDFACTVATDGCATRDLAGPDGTIIPAGQIQNAFIAALATVFAKTQTTSDIIASL